MTRGNQLIVVAYTIQIMTVDIFSTICQNFCLLYNFKLSKTVKNSNFKKSLNINLQIFYS